jgi:hypothetical protein
MNVQRLVIALTVINLALLTFLLARFPATMQDAQVLRGRSLEITDEHGRVRASITVHPANPTFAMPDGSQGYPETVMFRLIDPNGRPSVKLGGSEQGAGLGLAGETDTTYVVVKAEGARTSLKLTDRDGREQLIKP